MLLERSCAEKHVGYRIRTLIAWLKMLGVANWRKHAVRFQIELLRIFIDGMPSHITIYMAKIKAKNSILFCFKHLSKHYYTQAKCLATMTNTLPTG